MKMNIKNTLALTLALTMAVGTAACGKTETTDTESKVTTTTAAVPTDAEDSVVESEVEESKVESEAESKVDSEPAEDIKYIGEQDAAAADYSVDLKNGTDKIIVGFAIKYGNDIYSENLLPEGESFGIDEVRQFNWSHTVSGDVMALDDFTVELTFDNDQVYELHGFPLTDMTEGEIRLMEEYAFLVYTNKIGDNKNTMDSEAAIVEREREKETETTTLFEFEPEYDEPEDEPEETDPPATEPPATEDPVVTDPPVTDPPSADDGCVGDDGFFF